MTLNAYMNKEITLKKLKKYNENLLPRVNNVEENQLTFLWFEDFYDGPLNGILKFDNKEYRYEIVTDYKKVKYPRIFAIVELSENELKEEKYWHELHKDIVNDKYDDAEANKKLYKLEKKRKRIDHGSKTVLFYFVRN